MARATQGDQSQANVIIHILEAAEVKGVVSASYAITLID